MEAEDKLRASDRYQNMYSEKEQLDWYRVVTKKIQLEALSSQNLDESYLFDLNSARQLYQNDPEVNKLTVYMRHDRSTRGHLREGDDAPDVPLLDLDLNPCRFADHLATRTKPLFLIAGSIT